MDRFLCEIKFKVGLHGGGGRPEVRGSWTGVGGETMER